VRGWSDHGDVSECRRARVERRPCCCCDVRDWLPAHGDVQRGRSSTEEKRDQVRERSTIVVAIDTVRWATNEQGHERGREREGEGCEGAAASNSNSTSLPRARHEPPSGCASGSFYQPLLANTPLPAHGFNRGVGAVAASFPAYWRSSSVRLWLELLWLRTGKRTLRSGQVAVYSRFSPLSLSPPSCGSKVFHSRCTTPAGVPPSPAASPGLWRRRLMADTRSGGLIKGCRRLVLLFPALLLVIPPVARDRCVCVCVGRCWRRLTSHSHPTPLPRQPHPRTPLSLTRLIHAPRPLRPVG